MRSPEVSVRREASGQLSQLDAATARELTLAALRDSDSIVRLHALDAAGRLRLREARRFALQWLSDPDPRLRRAAARLIADMPDASDVQTLGRTLSDGDPTIRALAAEALGQTASEEAVPALLGQLDDQQPRVRVAITRALGQLGDRRAVSALMGRLHDPDGLVREAAAVALADIGDRRAIGPVALTLFDSEPGARAKAAAALGTLRADSTVAELERLGASDADARVRTAAFVAMGRFRSESGNEALLRALTRANEPSAVILGFAAAGPTATELLRECVAEALPRSSLCALAWVRADPNTAAAAIADALVAQQIPPGVALELLESLASPDAVPAAIQRLERGDVSERARAILVLDAVIRKHGPDGRIADPIGVFLGQASDSTERAALIQLLGRAGNPSVTGIVASFTSAKSSATVRGAAYGALHDLFLADAGRTREAIGDARLDAVLLAGLDDPDAGVRHAAALAVADAGGASLVEPILTRYSASPTNDRIVLAASLRGPLGSASATGSSESIQLAIERLVRARGRVRDAWLESLAPIPAAAQVLAGEPLDAADRAKLAEGLDTTQLALLQKLATDNAPRVRANAVWRLGAALPVSRLEPLAAALDDPDPAVSANAVASVARVAAATPETTNGHERAGAIALLCGAVGDGRSAARQNAVAGLLLIGATCERDGVVELLRRDPSESVRLLAARLLHAHSDANDRTSLIACAREDASGQVRSACSLLLDQTHESARAHAPRPTTSLLVDVVPASGRSVVGSAPFGLRFEDGLVRYGLADRRGRVREPAAPRGTVTLTVPASFRRN